MRASKCLYESRVVALYMFAMCVLHYRVEADDASALGMLPEVQAGSCEGVTEMDLYYIRPKVDPVATLVLLSYSGDTPEPMLEWGCEQIQKRWAESASKHRLLIVYANIYGNYGDNAFTYSSGVGYDATKNI